MHDLLSRGFIDSISRLPDCLRLTGWLATYEPSAVTSMQVEIGAQPREILDVHITDSPDIAKLHPFLSDAEICRFTIDVAATPGDTAGGALLSLRATFQFGRTCLPLFYVADPKVAQPSAEVVEAVGGGTHIGQEFLGYLVGLAGLKPGEAVLDIGCGVGRMAYPLAYFLPQGKGSYLGFDVELKSIKWAQKNLARAFPELDFRHADVRNRMYNPEGALDPLTFSFPTETDSIDVVFLSSVFTHMLHDEVEHYLDEIRRVLRPGGRLLVSCFLLDDTVRRLMAEGRSDRVFTLEMGPAFIERLDMPEAAVAYEDSLFKRWLADRGLHLEGRFHGAWSGREPFLSYQDILVATCS